MKCSICNTQHYSQTYTEPEERCLCGEGVTGDSPWQYAGWKGLWVWFRMSKLLKWTEAAMTPIYKWLYADFDGRIQ